MGKNKKQKQPKVEEKKHQHQHQQQQVKIQTEAASKEASKQEQMNKILLAISSMDLDTTEFIDVKSFDEGKQILLNMIEDLSFYIKLFEKGDYSKFPSPSSLNEVVATNTAVK